MHIALCHYCEYKSLDNFCSIYTRLGFHTHLWETGVAYEVEVASVLQAL